MTSARDLRDQLAKRRDLRRNPNYSLEVDESPWRSRRVLLHNSGLWSETEGGDGVLCTLLPIYGRDYVPYDCLAWAPERPGKWWRQRGIAVVLGEEDVRNAAWDQEPAIRLTESPAEWLEATPPCATILDWRCDLRRALWPIHRIECSTARLAHLLDRALAAQVRHRFRIVVGARR